jgi:aminoglycoside 3-N-acetyltransferase
MPKYSVQDLVSHLRRLGLNEGDTVLVRASLSKVGEIDGPGKRSEKILEALLSAVGEEGTILALSFTKAFLFPNKHPDYIFSSKTPPISGGLANVMVNWPTSIRSHHPTNSFVAIGKKAEIILQGHDERAPCFFPLEKLIELNGKMVLIGCVDESPGFSTVHLAQHHLQLSTKTIFKKLLSVRYIAKNGEIALFRKRDYPGCSMGFYRFYSQYVREGKLLTGWVGDAYSIAIKAAEAYEIEYAALKRNPKAALCFNRDCEFCRGGVYYNLSDWPGFYFRHIPKIIRKLWEYSSGN